MSERLHVVCPHCTAINRLPADRLAEGGKCGKCHRPLFDGRPAAFDAAAFRTQVEHSDVPVLVDFWAEWCGPCHMMAPVFERAAKELEPRVRLGKVDTEAEQAIAARLGIRGIPTLALFHHGREIARRAGASDLNGLLEWVRGHL